MKDIVAQDGFKTDEELYEYDREQFLAFINENYEHERVYNNSKSRIYEISGRRLNQVISYYNSKGSSKWRLVFTPCLAMVWRDELIFMAMDRRGLVLFGCYAMAGLEPTVEQEPEPEDVPEPSEDLEKTPEEVEKGEPKKSEESGEGPEAEKEPGEEIENKPENLESEEEKEHEV